MHVEELDPRQADTEGWRLEGSGGVARGSTGGMVVQEALY
jgi:hypothetical protein